MGSKSPYELYTNPITPTSVLLVAVSTHTFVITHQTNLHRVAYLPSFWGIQPNTKGTHALTRPPLEYTSRATRGLMKGVFLLIVLVHLRTLNVCHSLLFWVMTHFPQLCPLTPPIPHHEYLLNQKPNLVAFVLVHLIIPINRTYPHLLLKYHYLLHPPSHNQLMTHCPTHNHLSPLLTPHLAHKPQLQPPIPCKLDPNPGFLR